jgi:hypothetical protein
MERGEISFITTTNANMLKEVVVLLNNPINPLTLFVLSRLSKRKVSLKAMLLQTMGRVGIMKRLGMKTTVKGREIGNARSIVLLLPWGSHWNDCHADGAVMDWTLEEYLEYLQHLMEQAKWLS